MGRGKAAFFSVICLAAVFGWGALAQVPDPSARQLAQHLASGERPLTDTGFMRAAGPFAGALSAHGVARVPITLRAGQDYRVFGVCDAACGGIGLRLYDAGATTVAETTGASPLIAARPQRTGQFLLEIDMGRCAQPPCYYAVNIYSR
ncbi:MAG: hypothetical protein AB7L65_00660 [Hyphomonadaceae bacterium]